MNASRTIALAAMAVATVVLAGFAIGCSDPKKPGCKGDKDCKNGLVCASNKCVECKDDSTCPKGKRCEANACVTKPECTKDSECTGGKVCQAGGSANRVRPITSAAWAARARRGVQEGETSAHDEDCADDEDCCVGGFCKKAGTSSTHRAVSARDRLSASTTRASRPASATGSMPSAVHREDQGQERLSWATPIRRVPRSTTSRYPNAVRVGGRLHDRLGTDPARLQVVPKGETEPTGMATTRTAAATSVEVRTPCPSSYC
jgi:Cys-rich repeat protein